jgi:hypothetical protein
MNEATTTQLWFGHGVISQTGFDTAFNSGITIMLYETGLVGTALLMFLIFKLSQRLIIFIFFLFAALFVNPVVMPLFWFGIIIAFHKLKNETINANISYKN